MLKITNFFNMKVNPKNLDFPSCKKLGLKNGDTVDFVEFDGFDYRVSHAKNIIIADSDGYYFDISRCSRKDSDYSGYCSYIPISNIFAINGVPINNTKATNILVSITENELKKVKEEEKEIYNMFENKYKCEEIKMHELKIKIKEVVEEERPLTREEWLICSYHDQFRYPCTEEYLQDIGLHFDINMNFDDSENKWGVGKFRKETIRDATPDEEFAYYELKALDIYLSLKELDKVQKCCQYVGKKKFYEEILKDKEIILEIE